MTPLLILPLLLSQADPALPAGVKRGYAPRDAAIQAMLDAGSLPNGQREYTFYIWDNTGSKESTAIASWTVNAVMSRAGTIILPTIIHNPNGPKLLRWNLYEIAPVKKDFDKLRDAWESMTDNEPYFRQPIAKFAKKYKKEQRTRKVTKQVKVPLPQYGPGTYKLETQEVEESYEVDVEDKATSKTEPGIHAGGAGPLQLLSTFTKLNLPIVRLDWFIATAWSDLEIDGVVGKYSLLAGIGKGQDGQTDFDAFMESIGADPKAVRRLRSDQRTVMISGVTGKWRTVEAFFGLGVRPEDGGQLVTITHDLVDAEKNAKRHPLLNLLEFEDQAREIIAAKRNGLHLFVLTNGQGALQKEAPPDVAAWPASPHVTKRLTSGISCVECHGPGGGYNPVENYVRELSKGGVFPYGDFSSKEDARDVLDRLRGLYDGDLTIPLRVAANGYAGAVDRATSGVFGGKTVETASVELLRIYSSYFGKVTGESVLRDLGYIAEPKAVKAAIRDIIPPSVDEDGRIAALRLGLPLKRSDIHEIFFEIALRDVLKPSKVQVGVPIPKVEGGRERFNKTSQLTERQQQELFAAWRLPSTPSEVTNGNIKLPRANQRDSEIVAGHSGRSGFGVSANPVAQSAQSLEPRVDAVRRASEVRQNAIAEPAQATTPKAATPQVAANRVTLVGVSVVDAGESSMEHYAPPGTQIWYVGEWLKTSGQPTGEQWSHYDGQVAASGTKYSTVKSLRPGEVWSGYNVVVKFPNGVVKRKKVDLAYRKKTVIDWMAA